MQKFVLFVLAFCGLPLVWALFWTLMEGLAIGLTKEAWLAPNPIGFCGGALLMGLLYLWQRQRLNIVYVFAHESTHALVGLCCLAKIHEFKVSDGGGHVQLSKSNLLITLSPYCVPLFLLLSTLLHALLNLFFPDLLPAYIWCGIFGFFTFFHILFTLDALITVSQPDTHVYGRFFSYWFILCANLFFALLAIYIIDLVGWREQINTFCRELTSAYSVASQWFRDGVIWFIDTVTAFF